MLKKYLPILVGYSFIHGLIDISCAAVVFATIVHHKLGVDSVFILVVAYNVVAFGLQLPFGYLVDKYRVPRESAFVGVFLVLLSILSFGSPVLVAIFAGLGNAFFHVGGGSIALNISPQKAAAPGVFVAPGAIGLTLGVLIGKNGYFLAWPFIVALGLSCLFILKVKIPSIDYRKISLRPKIKFYELVIFLLLLSVSIRALYGLTAVFDWKSDVYLLLILTGAIFLGKALGGFLADRFGWLKTAVFALLVSAPLLSFFQDSPALAILGAFLFQLTMPITLTALSNMLPGRSATAFSLAVFALIVGALPVYFGVKSVLSNNWITFAVVCVSAASLLTAFKFLYKYFNTELKIKL